MDIENCIVYDVEIANTVKSTAGGWSNPEGMGFGSAVAYEYATDRYHFFLHDSGKDRLIELLNDKTAITFNGIKFDSKVLLGNDRLVHLRTGKTYTDKTFWDNYDILLEYICSRYSCTYISQSLQLLDGAKILDGSFNLNALCKATIGIGKTGHGKDAPSLYTEGKYDELLDYNFNDVRITKVLFDHILKYMYVIDKKNRVVRLKKRW